MSANTKLTEQQQSALLKLKELYTRVPNFKCKRNCADCCGPHIQAEVEWLNISIWLLKHKRQELIGYQLNCPYLTKNRCSIYPVRPMVCRLFGAVQDLRCPHGYHPKKRIEARRARWLLSQTITLLPPSSHGIGES